MQTDPGHNLEFRPSEKHFNGFMGWLGLHSTQADALMTEAERIK